MTMATGQTGKLFQIVSQLTPEQFTQTVAGSYGSIRNTLVDILSVEWGWLDRCGGPERGPALKPDDFPTLQSLTVTWSTVEGSVRDFLSKLKDTDLVRGDHVWPIFLGLVLVFAIGTAVGPVVRSATKAGRPSPPVGIDANVWLDIIGRGSAASVLGHLERLLAFAAFWQEAPIIIAGWLAFKVASGWNNWSFIVRLPEKIEGVKDLDYLRARSQLGSWVFHRFLIGTLSNVLAGLGAAVVAKSLSSR